MIQFIRPRSTDVRYLRPKPAFSDRNTRFTISTCRSLGLYVLPNFFPSRTALEPVDSALSPNHVLFIKASIALSLFPLFLFCHADSYFSRKRLQLLLVNTRLFKYSKFMRRKSKFSTCVQKGRYWAYFSYRRQIRCCTGIRYSSMRVKFNRSPDTICRPCKAG